MTSATVLATSTFVAPQIFLVSLLAGWLNQEQQKILELTSIADEEWAKVKAEGVTFWDEIADETLRTAQVVRILRPYNEAMGRAGRPYRYP